MDPRDILAEARTADPLSTVEALGYTVKHFSGNEYNLLEHDSLIINPEKGWYWNSRDVGGRSTIDLVMALEGIDKPLEAAKVIIRSVSGHIDERASNRRSDIPKETKEKSFVLPERNTDHRRVFAYLNTTRGISRKVIERCMKEGILYEARETHNAVFVGKDRDGTPRYAFERGTNPGKRFLKEVFGSKKEHGFRIEGDSSTLHVFESAVDALSFLTLKEYLKQENSDTCLALSGTALKALEQFMDDHPGKIREIDVRTDNDPAGRRILKKIKDRYEGCCHINCRLPAELKDYNEVLLEVNRSKEWLSGEGLNMKIGSMIRGDPAESIKMENSLVRHSITEKRKPKDKDHER